ncbi:hypothetical protein EDB80DRAFT_811779 [Ilyonectria destructans]|nr:hypothetical protein EDB80DRAFT_811779 [Ilyonectria destructans]
MPHKSPHPDIPYPKNQTVWSWLFESARFRSLPENYQPAVINAITKEQITFRQLKQYAEQLSGDLVRRCGLTEGDTAILFSPNTIWYPVAMHAIIRVGGIVGGLSPSSNAEELQHGLQVSKAKYVFTSLETLDVALQAVSAVGIPQDRVILFEGERSGHYSIRDWIGVNAAAHGPSHVPAFTIPTGKLNSDVCGYLSFTSGTTGKPKACMISHGNVIAQCLQMAEITSPDVDKVLAILPLYHITGLVHLLHLPIFRNADIVLLPKFSMQSMLKTIVDYQLRELILVPPLFIRLVQDAIVNKYDLSCVRRFSSGAAPLPPRVIEQLQEKFPWTGFKQGYGMTESCSCLTAHSPDHYDYKYSSTVGTILPSTDLKFVDGRGNEVDEGEILARGPQCAMGYVENPQASIETFGKDGWLRTGDIGKMLANGCVQITGRIKEIIKVKGVGVAPAELEELLLSHPKVLDAAVIGKPDDYTGERPHACVVVAPDIRPSKELSNELIKFVQGRKMRSKWIHGVTFIRSVPRAGSGKVLRRELKAQLDDLQVPVARL